MWCVVDVWCCYWLIIIELTDALRPRITLSGDWIIFFVVVVGQSTELTELWSGHFQRNNSQCVHNEGINNRFWILFGLYQSFMRLERDFWSGLHETRTDSSGFRDFWDFVGCFLTFSRSRNGCQRRRCIRSCSRVRRRRRKSSLRLEKKSRKSLEKSQNDSEDLNGFERLAKPRQKNHWKSHTVG